MLAVVLCFFSTTTRRISETLYNIYPNPFSDHLILNLDADDRDFRITDQSGRVVLHSTGTTSLDHLDQLQSGLYFLSIVNGNSGRILQTSKVIKQ
ncbi:MAG TPA: T9SS type A sorting domain-containing protein [Saprospiraceae bacterium]|nr:T9SS type A sorting domain-containing protein [Saprospiraceae bacterium]